MTRLFAISGAALANAIAASLFATAVAAQDVTTDIGTLDKEAAEKAFPAKPPYSPYAGRNFPTRPFFGDTHTAHLVFDGRGRVRRAARPEGRLSLRQGRGGHRVQRAACQAFAAAGFPGGDRPLGRHGLFPATDRRRSRPAGDAAGPEMVRRDQFRQGRAGRRRYHHQLRQGPDAEGLPDPGHARLSQRLARDDQGGGRGERAGPLHRLHRLRVDLERRRQQSSSQRHLARQRRKGEPGRAVHDPAAARQPQSARSVEVDGDGTRKRPAPKSSPSRTTAI